LNPFNVNVVVYIGHGALLPNNDAVAMIPYKDEHDLPRIRLINLQKYARELAQNRDQINIFLFSACRTYLIEYGNPKNFLFPDQYAIAGLIEEYKKY
jgi:hypothetical protein